jgi:hypothetical protein
MPTPSFMPKMAARWRESEYLQVYCAALPFIEDGVELRDAICMAQAQWVVPDRQRADIDAVVSSETMRKVVALAKRLSPQSRQEQADALKREHKLWEVVSAENRPRVYWSDREWARLKREVDHMRLDLGDKRSVPLLAVDAQMKPGVLPEHRWRAKSVLLATYGKGETHGVEANFKRIAPQVDELLKEEPPAEPAPPPAPPARISEVFPDSTPEEDHRPVKSLRTLVREAAAKLPVPGRDPEQPQEPLRAIQAPQASPPPEKRSHGPLDAFAGHLASAMSALFDAAATHAAANLEANVRRITEQLMEGVAQALDQRQQEFTRALVQASLEASLGGPVTVPEVGQEPLKLDLSGEGLATRLKIDVVGLWPRQAAEAKKALNGYADTVRFIDPTKIDSWTPRDLVIASSRHPSRSVEDKCRKAHAHVTRVWGTAESVVDAVKGLYAQAGVDVTQHH